MYVVTRTIYVVTRIIYVVTRTLYVVTRTMYVVTRTMYVVTGTMYVVTRTMYVVTRNYVFSLPETQIKSNICCIVNINICSGITALGLDHTSLLGNSIKDIAWHKAGIMKPGVTTYVDPHQKETALEVIKQRSLELGSCAVGVPPLGFHHWPGLSPPSPGLHGEVQTHNASLAVALSSHFLSVHNKCVQPPPVIHQAGHLLPVLAPIHLTTATARGLQMTRWPGRTQVVRREGVEYYLDGAHTEESMMACVEWFSKASRVDKVKEVYRVLVFNTTGDRDVETLLEPLKKLDINLVIFCTNISRNTDSVDQQNFTTNEQMQLDKCEIHLAEWARLKTECDNHHVPGLVIPCINDALLWATAGRDTVLPSSYYSTPPHPAPTALLHSDLVQLLVTGSLHLVGGVVGCIR